MINGFNISGVSDTSSSTIFWALFEIHMQTGFNGFLDL